LSLQSLQPEEEKDLFDLVDRLTAGIIQGNKEQSDWKEHTEALKANLMHLHDCGLVPTKFDRHGYGFSVTAGRSTVEFDDCGKEKIEQLKQHLIDTGHGVVKIGSPFWGTRERKPPKATARVAADSSPLMRGSENP
jgi:hypothetical protein